MKRKEKKTNNKKIKEKKNKKTKKIVGCMSNVGVP